VRHRMALSFKPRTLLVWATSLTIFSAAATRYYATMSKQSGIELQDLSKPKRAAAVPEDNAGLNALKPEPQLSALGVTEEDDGVMSAWAWTSAAL
jgi:hypothetical protein